MVTSLIHFIIRRGADCLVIYRHLAKAILATTATASVSPPRKMQCPSQCHATTTEELLAMLLLANIDTGDMLIIET